MERLPRKLFSEEQQHTSLFLSPEKTLQGKAKHSNFEMRGGMWIVEEVFLRNRQLVVLLLLKKSTIHVSLAVFFHWEISTEEIKKVGEEENRKIEVVTGKTGGDERWSVPHIYFFPSIKFNVVHKTSNISGVSWSQHLASSLSGFLSSRCALHSVLHIF